MTPFGNGFHALDPFLTDSFRNAVPEFVQVGLACSLAGILGGFITKYQRPCVTATVTTFA